MTKCPLKRWAVTVTWASGSKTTSFIVAPTRGKAMVNAWRSDAFSGSTFRQFLCFARCHRADDPDWWGAPITVRGKPAFYLGHDRQYVHFCWPGDDHDRRSHPYDVLPIERRSEPYRHVEPAA